MKEGGPISGRAYNRHTFFLRRQMGRTAGAYKRQFSFASMEISSVNKSLVNFIPWRTALFIYIYSTEARINR